jgi:hypothetical protein
MTSFKAMKKPLVVDVWEIDGSDQWPEWASGDLNYIVKNTERSASGIGINRKAFLRIETLEGIMDAQLGDFLIKGIKGELYPCRRDIFLETYEAVEND